MTGARMSTWTNLSSLKQTVSTHIMTASVAQPHNSITALSTLCSEKTPTYVFNNYNSGISRLIFILFVPMETGINTLQYTYLMA